LICDRLSHIGYKNTNSIETPLAYHDIYVRRPVALTPGKGSLFPRHPDGSRDLDQEIKGDFTITYRAMEKLVETGKTKAIGVSNFSTHNLDILLKSTSVVPAVNQVELHRKFKKLELQSRKRVGAFCNMMGFNASFSALSLPSPEQVG
jgi:diketogulonate reductase-like aldo/keto reductase